MRLAMNPGNPCLRLVPMPLAREDRHLLLLPLDMVRADEVVILRGVDMVVEALPVALEEEVALWVPYAVVLPAEDEGAIEARHLLTMAQAPTMDTMPMEPHLHHDRGRHIRRILMGIAVLLRSIDSRHRVLAWPCHRRQNRLVKPLK